MELGELEGSDALMKEVRNNPRLEVLRDSYEFFLGKAGNLIEVS